MVTYVLGDVHGRYRALQKVTKHLDFENDILIILGDVCDGGRHTKDCIDLLLTVKNRILIAGNHDYWTLEWFLTGSEPWVWTSQGGYRTMESYGFDRKSIPWSHIEFLKSAIKYHTDPQNKLYVHGGFDPNISIEKQSFDYVMWDRDIIAYARKQKIPNYVHVFIGHTTTQLIGGSKCIKPLTFNNLTMVDTGAGWNGKLTMMNTDTFEYFQSAKQNPQVDV